MEARGLTPVDTMTTAFPATGKVRLRTNLADYLVVRALKEGKVRSDLVELFRAAREPGGLAGMSADFDDDWAVTVVLASAGYPESSSKGDVIRGLAEAGAIAEVTHAGTAATDGEIVTSGGRVLNVTGLGPDPAAARDQAYDAASRIAFEGMQIRSDIAARAVARVSSP